MAEVECDLARELAIIIPVGPFETAWKVLLNDLEYLPSEIEILLVGPTPVDAAELSTSGQIRWIQTIADRGKQLNAGAFNTKRTYLWFLHADTRVTPNAYRALVQSLRTEPTRLYFFDLRFQNDGPKWMRLNTLGVRFRSRKLKIPFGDQGFCVSQTTFKKLGGFPEKVTYGEDHLFVWKAHQNHIPICSTNAVLLTSARKYQRVGWLKLTSKYAWMTFKQATPELIKLFKK